MPEQLSLDGLASGESRRHDLFFALFPAADAVARIEDLTEGLRRRYPLKGRPLKAGRLHLSLQYLGEHGTLPEPLLARAREAAARVGMPPFTVAFDRVASFQTRAGKRPVVLLAGDELPGLMSLHQALEAALRSAGIAPKGPRRLTPHVTLLYDASTVPEQPIEPIAWTVRELVLVDSWIGETHYGVLGRWPLGTAVTTAPADHGA